MSSQKKAIWYWGKHLLGIFGISAGLALVFLVIQRIGNGDISNGIGELILNTLGFYPYYVLVIGNFAIVMFTLGFFQSYFCVLISMNATRRTVVRGLLVTLAGGILADLGVMWLIWTLLADEMSEMGLSLLPLFAGILFIVASLSVLFGIVAARWGKFGVIIMTVIGLITGGCFGVFIALGGSDIEWLAKMQILDLTKKQAFHFPFMLVFAAGAAAYLLTAVFAQAAVRKIEVRA